MESNGYITLVILPFLLLLGCENDRTPTEVDTKFGTWTKVENNVTNWLYGIDFLDTQNGWIGGIENIYKTKDAGNSWTLDFTPENDFLYSKDKYFISKNIGWVLNYNGQI